jgi:hypothetical protein
MVDAPKAEVVVETRSQRFLDLGVIPGDEIERDGSTTQIMLSDR